MRYFMEIHRLFELRGHILRYFVKNVSINYFKQVLSVLKFWMINKLYGMVSDSF